MIKIMYLNNTTLYKVWVLDEEVPLFLPESLLDDDYPFLEVRLRVLGEETVEMFFFVVFLFPCVGFLAIDCFFIVLVRDFEVEVRLMVVVYGG
ncbi:hypothetical protein L484_002662 [Morus notabilis]|uniref:Uncharacterized protein n=1 Tax=Morus notabilis TaxID=981085 RepID=W9R0N3_9ROSA|nr:hypothetical protein L484_002662 [Morus notabilis]